PEIQPIVTEYQQHRLICHGGCSTCGELPKGVPTGQAGPRLIAFTALLMACFRQSKRRGDQALGGMIGRTEAETWAGWMSEAAVIDFPGVGHLLHSVAT